MASDFVAMALNDIELLENEFRIQNVCLDFLKVDYRLLRTFLLCARKWDYGLTSKSGNNVNLKSLLNSIESTVCENMVNLYNLFLHVERFHQLGLNYHMIHIKMGMILSDPCLTGKSSDPCLTGKSSDPCLTGKSSPLGSNSSSILVKKKYYDDFEMVLTRGALDDKVEAIRRVWIGALRKEISESYFSLLDYYSSLQYHSSWDQQLIMKFIDSLLVNVKDIQTWIRVDDQFLLDLIALKEKVTFLKNFISFAEWRGCEQRQLEVLFSHLFVVTINAAASVFYMWSFSGYDEVFDMWSFSGYDDKEVFDNEMWLSFSQRLQMMNPVDPQICETYIQVLTAWNNPSASSHARTLKTKMDTILGDFVGSLLYQAWQALTRGTTFMVSSEDQMPILWEGLRFLRNILKKHLEKLPNKVKDLIAFALAEAGIVICPLLVHKLKEALAKEMDIALFNLRGKIKLIKVVASAFIFPKTHEIGFMDFFLENLKELPSCKVDSIVLAKDQIQTILEDLVSLRSLLDNILEQRNHHEKIQALCNRVAEVAYKAQFIIQSLVAGDISDSSPTIFNPITQEIDLIKMEALKTGDNKCSFATPKAIRTSNPLASRGSTPAVNKVELRLGDEVNKTIELLTRGSKQLDIISIVGMPGLGKTTLARNVYDDPSITDVFHIRAWCVVSQAYTKKDLVLQILGCIFPKLSDHDLKKNESDLEEELKKHLFRNKYLIVFDDVWDSEAWSGLKTSFPNDVNGSRILLTSRHADVARKINPNREPHPLRQLTDNESWELLQTKLSCREGFNVKLGRKIAKNCKGLPLTVVIVAGILANLGLDGWEEIAERLSLSALSNTEHCMDILELSYRNLPDYLKPCLLYFGAFPEDQQIPFGKLMRLWIAEGFVQKSDRMSLEDVAKDYMNDLIGRSLVMISKERSIGGVKSCRIHDLLHEFCLTKAKKENFLCLFDDESFTFNGQHDPQRLCFYSQLEHFQELGIFCPNVRSLLFFPLANWSRKHCRLLNLCIFKLLKVLDLVEVNLGFIFPSQLLLLVELRYLAARGKFESIPPLITNLSNLETLTVDRGGDMVVLPDTIWNMQKLRYLFGVFTLLASSFTTDNLEMSSGLHNLDTFSLLNLSFGQSMKKILRKLPNVRRLKCELFYLGDCNRIVETSFLSQLQSLHLLFNGPKYHIEFRFPLHLKKLSLSYFGWSSIQEMRDLPNLEVLKLYHIGYERDTWDMEQEWLFPRLKYLELESGIVRWTSSGDHFPCLEKLVLQRCWYLEEVPSCLEYIPALQMIEVRGCYWRLLKSSLGKIEEEQKNSGNEEFKVVIFK